MTTWLTSVLQIGKLFQTIEPFLKNDNMTVVTGPTLERPGVVTPTHPVSKVATTLEALETHIRCSHALNALMTADCFSDGILLNTFHPSADRYCFILFCVSFRFVIPSPLSPSTGTRHLERLQLRLLFDSLGLRLRTQRSSGRFCRVT